MNHRVGYAILASLGLGILTNPPARACTPEAAHLERSIPEDGASYPPNAAILFYGIGLSLDELVVTVGEAPANLISTSVLGLSGNVYGFSYIAAHVEPAPVVGSVVTIHGPPGSGCEETTLHYTASSSDVSSPVLRSISFDLYEYAPTETEEVCSYAVIGLSWFLEAIGTPELAEAAPIVYQFEGFRDPTLTDRILFSSSLSSSARFDAASTIVGEADPPQAVCFRLTPTDLAGNVGSALTTCLPCHYREDEGGYDTYPSEPSWTEADLYCGGECSGVSSAPCTDGDDDSDGSGCLGCGVAGGRSPGIPTLLLVLSFSVWVLVRRV